MVPELEIRGNMARPTVQVSAGAIQGYYLADVLRLCFGGQHMKDRIPKIYSPLPCDLLPGPLREYVITASEVLRCDPVGPAMSCLAGCAASIGNARNLEVKTEHRLPTCEPVVLFDQRQRITKDCTDQNAIGTLS